MPKPKKRGHAPTQPASLRTGAFYTLKSSEAKPVSQKWSMGKKVLAGLLGVGVAVAGYVGVRQLVSLFKSSVPVEPSTQGGVQCSDQTLLGLSYKPGYLVLPAGEDPSMGFKFPFLDEGEGWTHTTEQSNYVRALKWFQTQPDITSLSGEAFVKMIDILQKKVMPEGPHHYRTHYVFVAKNDNLKLFDPNSDLTTELSEEETATLAGITEKVNLAIDEYVGSAGSYTGEDSYRLKETIAIELTEQGRLQGMEEDVPEKYQLTDAEKDFIRTHYDYKPEYSVKAMKAHLRTEFEAIVKAHKHNSEKMAAYLHMLVVDVHPYMDGNGRIARALFHGIRRFHQLPVLAFPHRRDQMDVVHESLRRKDYEIFWKYVEKLAKDANGKLREICQYLKKKENKCDALDHYRDCVQYMVTHYVEKAKREAATAHHKVYRAEKEFRMREIRKKH